MKQIPIVTLSNGLKVANFSSPHEFEFSDGTILPAVSNERADDMKVDFIEDKEETEKGFKNVSLDFGLMGKLLKEVYEYWKDPTMYGDVDVILVPLPMILAIKNDFPETYIPDTPFRSIRMVSRLDKKVRIDEFCV